MNITKIRTIFFSPTGTSKKVVKAIAEGGKMPDDVNELDLTYPGYNQEVVIAGDELAIIGVPVYGGRVAPLARERLKAIRGNNSPAVIVVVYGNREFDDALIELRDIVAAQSFSVVAAGAFIGAHSFSSARVPIAEGRPDKIDFSVAGEFGAKVMERIRISATEPGSLQVPGDVPYLDGMKKLPFTPQINTEECTQCEICISSCPAGAISLDTSIEIEPQKCTFCCACIKDCPEDAITIAAPPLMEKAEWLHTNCRERKEPQLFF